MERTYALETPAQKSKQVLVQGWVDSVRDHGQLLFIDLRDVSGKVQVVVDPAEQADIFKVAKDLRSEFVIEVKGVVSDRDPDLVNPKLATGEIEIRVEELTLLNKSKPMPFPINTHGGEIDETVRFKQRYLDLRRDRLQEIITKKHKLFLAVRNWMDAEGFREVQTPLLTSTSPEGARDFVIPSRLHPGKFFVLPQAPQQYKQLLMVGGIDKYFQIAPCARDEDPRADRHAGVFYQIDMEMSFPTIDKIFATAENLIKETYKTVAPDKEIMEFPFPRIPYAEAMNRFGSDKPDLRFGMELQEISELVKGKTDFNVFNGADVIKAVVVEGAGEWSRKEIEAMETFAKQLGGKGLAYTKVTDSGLETGIAKFLEPVASDLIKQVSAKPGDLLFFGADKEEVVWKVLGGVRSEAANILGLKDNQKLAFAWITDFPFYEKDEKTGKIDFGHNPFSMPKGGAEAFEAEDPLTIQSNQYDLALNGYEILSGSIRNHNPETLVKAFEVVGYGREEILKRFGAMYNAFQYGAPPHGGWAIGFDRMFMVLVDEENIRDIYAFPKSSSGIDLMMNAPSELNELDMKIAGIDLSQEVKLKLMKQDGNK
jgi:aspartyl-tRNA synthetase